MIQKRLQISRTKIYLSFTLAKYRYFMHRGIIGLYRHTKCFKFVPIHNKTDINPSPASIAGGSSLPAIAPPKIPFQRLLTW
jgi:hypothetical protein